MKWLILKASHLPQTHNKTDENSQETLQYALLNKPDDHSTFKTIEWSTIKSRTSGYRVLLLIPSEQVTLTTTHLPITNKKQLAKALPYSLEEHLADDIENLHFVHHQDKNKQLYVSIINKQQLQQWLTACAHYSVKPYAILPDLFAIPIADKQWTICLDNERALIRKNELSGYVTDPDLLPIFIPQELAQSALKPEHILTDDETLFSTLFSNKDSEKNELIDSISQKTAKSLSQVCSSSLIKALPLNLINHFYTGDTSVLKEYINQWKTPIIIGIVAAITSIGFTVIDNQSIKTKMNQLEKQMIHVFKQALPNGRVDSDYRLMGDQLSEKIIALQGGDQPKGVSVLQLLSAISLPLKNNRLIKLKKINYHHQKLVLSLSAKELTSLEAFTNTLKKPSLTINISNATTSANRVDAEITITSSH